MINKICGLQSLKIIIILILIGCKNEEIKNTSITIQEYKTIKKSYRFEKTVLKILKNSEFELEVETRVSNDTLDLIDYKENIYSSPIILSQKMLFFKNKKLIKEYVLPIKHVNKKTIHEKTIKALEMPLYNICLIKSKGSDYYIAYGSDYCNGADCPEFIGIYSMNGRVIYEGFSTIKGKVSLKSIILKYKINLDNLSPCINI
jgi:uncharacterized protein YjfI (DUF2170 family)